MRFSWYHSASSKKLIDGSWAATPISTIEARLQHLGANLSAESSVQKMWNPTSPYSRQRRWSRRRVMRRLPPCYLPAILILAALAVTSGLYSLNSVANSLPQVPVAPPLPQVRTPFGSVNRVYRRLPRNCTEAHELGLANIPRGSPYYAPWLDRDGDGWACEPWRGHYR